MLDDLLLGEVVVELLAHLGGLVGVLEHPGGAVVDLEVGAEVDLGAALDLADVELGPDPAGHADGRPVGGGVGDGAVGVGGLDEAGVLAQLDEGDLDLGADLLAVLTDLALRRLRVEGRSRGVARLLALPRIGGGAGRAAGPGPDRGRGGVDLAHLGPQGGAGRDHRQGHGPDEQAQQRQGRDVLERRRARLGATACGRTQRTDGPGHAELLTSWTDGAGPGVDVPART